MNLTLHLVAWDLRCLRPYLALWLGLVVLQAALIVSYIGLPSHFFPPDAGFSSEAREVLLALFTWLVAVLKICLLAVLVARLVHKDPTVGNTAFWLSRPLSRVRLLAGKSLFLLLAVILPSLLVEAVLLLICGVTPQDTLRSVPQILLLTLLAVAPLTMLAAVTTNLARTSLLGVLVFLGLAVLVTLLLAWRAIRRVLVSDFVSDFGIGLPGASLVLVATALIVIAHQYLTRRTVGSRVLLFSGVALASWFLASWSLHTMTKGAGPCRRSGNPGCGQDRRQHREAQPLIGSGEGCGAPVRTALRGDRSRVDPAQGNHRPGPASARRPGDPGANQRPAAFAFQSLRFHPLPLIQA